MDKLKRLTDIDLITRVELIGELAGIFGYESENLIMIGGAITTPERFANFSESLCHLSEDGIIRRLGRQIGSIDDIEELNKEARNE